MLNLVNDPISLKIVENERNIKIYSDLDANCELMTTANNRNNYKYPLNKLLCCTASSKTDFNGI